MSGLTDDELERVASVGRLERLVRGHVMPLDGPTALIVIDGLLRVFRNAPFARDVTLFLAKRGDVLAPGVLFAQRAGESGAIAIVPSRIALISADAFAMAAANDGSLYVALARNVSYRTAQVYAKLERLSRAPAESRVAAALLEIRDDFGEPLPGGGHHLELALSQADLAHFAGTTRATTSTVMAAFARRGLIRGSRLSDLDIIDGVALTSVAEAVV